MKCIKNLKTGSIMRVEDSQANNMVGQTWVYVSKSEWKGMQVVDKEDVAVSHDMGGPIENKVKKRKAK